MCGDFKCSRYTLIGLNIGYILVAFILIGVAAAGKSSNLVTSLPVIGGIVACGVFLLFIAIVGIFGAIKHHQVMLFFYMIVLFSIFVIQFSVACACLASSEEDELNILKKAWSHANEDAIFDAEKTFECCGFSNITMSEDACKKCKTISGIEIEGNCTAEWTSPAKFRCDEKIKAKVDRAFNASGTVGLLFAFTEIIGAYLAYHFEI
jgi:tetraspanin-13/31